MYYNFQKIQKESTTPVYEPTSIQNYILIIA